MRKGKDPTRETRTSNEATARGDSHRPYSKICRFLGEVKGSVKDSVNKFRPSRSKDSSSHCPVPSNERTSSTTNIEVAPSGVEVEADTQSAFCDAQQAARRMHLHSTPHLHTSAPPFSPATSPISRQLSAQFPNTRCVTSGRDIHRPAVQAMLKGHTPSVTPVLFSPDGTLIVTGSSDNTVRLWDAGTGEPVGEPLQGHTSAVTSVSFLPDGTRIVTGSYDTTIRLWDTPATQPLQQCGALDHPASSDEHHIIHPNESTTTMTLNDHFIRFSSNSIHALHNTSELMEGASHDDRSSTPFLLNRDTGWMPWHCISDTQRMSYA